MRKLSRSELKLGEPLPFSIHDTDGRLLLRKGTVITIPGQIEKLVARGVLIEDGKGEGGGPSQQAAASGASGPASRNASPVAEEVPPVFDRMSGLVLNLKHVFTTALKSPDQIDLPARIRNIAATLQALCSEDIDGALASPYLDFHNPYIVVHQLMGAIMAELITLRKGLSPVERLPYVCAALTRDIAQLPIQAELDKCTGPLPGPLKEAMQGHAFRGAELLARAGVTHRGWLEAVRQHHERMDGSGYPNKLAGDGISLGGKVLAVADIYSAMAKPRPYRGNKSHAPLDALRNMYMEKDTSLDGGLVQMLIKEIGMMPPGSIVRLKNGEVAVVKSRTNNAAEAVVYSVYDQKGMPLMEPVRRETQSPDFGIAGRVAFEECRSAAVTIKRVWTK